MKGKIKCKFCQSADASIILEEKRLKVRCPVCLAEYYLKDQHISELPQPQNCDLSGFQVEQSIPKAVSNKAVYQDRLFPVNY